MPLVSSDTDDDDGYHNAWKHCQLYTISPKEASENKPVDREIVYRMADCTWMFHSFAFYETHEEQQAAIGELDTIKDEYDMPQDKYDAICELMLNPSLFVLNVDIYTNHVDIVAIMTD